MMFSTKLTKKEGVHPLPTTKHNRWKDKCPLSKPKGVVQQHGETMKWKTCLQFYYYANGMLLLKLKQLGEEKSQTNILCRTYYVIYQWMNATRDYFVNARCVDIWMWRMNLTPWHGLATHLLDAATKQGCEASKRILTVRGSLLKKSSGKCGSRIHIASRRSLGLQGLCLLYRLLLWLLLLRSRHGHLIGHGRTKGTEHCGISIQGRLHLWISKRGPSIRHLRCWGRR